jgi:hypothetical protein
MVQSPWGTKRTWLLNSAFYGTCISLPIHKNMALNPLLSQIIHSTSWQPLSVLISCLLHFVTHSQEHGTETCPEPVIQSTSWYPTSNLNPAVCRSVSVHQSGALSPVLSQIIKPTSWYPIPILIHTFCSTLLVNRIMLIQCYRCTDPHCPVHTLILDTHFNFLPPVCRSPLQSHVYRCAD